MAVSKTKSLVCYSYLNKEDFGKPYNKNWQ